MSTPTMVSASVLCAAELLEGVELPTGWRIVEKIKKLPTSTGGNFSVPYLVERIGDKSKKKAFLKALNFRSLAAAPDFLRAVQQHTAAFNFERDTLALCKEKGLRKVAHLLEAGEYRPATSSLPVCYIKSAAEFILENEAIATESAKSLARHLLGLSPPDEVRPLNPTRSNVFRGIKQLKAQRVTLTAEV